MNSISVFALIVLAIVIIVNVIVRFMYKNSVMSIISRIITLVASCVTFLGYIIGSQGLSHLVWAAPLGLTIVLVGIIILNNLLVKPIGIITDDIVNKLTEGELGFSFEKKILNRNDELGKISNALEKMKKQLNTTVSEILNISDIISASSKQQNLYSQQISQGATEQAASIEEVSSSMEEMKSNMEQNSDNAKHTEVISVTAVQEIRSLLDSGNKSLKSITEIADKIKIINDIAFQTNLLALNAAVEAARAGDHGRGFAIVAAEVRKLAERSKLAANDINVLSNLSVNLTSDAGKKMGTLAPAIEKTSKMIQEISASTAEQSMGAEQINKSIMLLNEVIQINASTSEELAGNAQELSDYSVKLTESLRFFKH